MDWGRAKTIFILSFLCLNLLLGFQLWTNRTEQAESNPEKEAMSEKTNRVLAEKHIRLEAEIPAETPNLREITVKFEKDVERQTALHPPVKWNASIHKKEWKQRFANKIDQIDAYQLDPAASVKGQYVLNQLHGQYPMFEVNLRLFHNEEEVYAYTQSYVRVLPGSGQKDQEVLSAFKAIGNLAENYLPAGSVIQDIRLGYHGQMYNSETQLLAPYWRVMLAGGEVYYVHAISGAVEDPQKGK